uniref:E3 ubiquitin-protein ligase TRIM8 n=1 Tax=Myripristis murdjan TaxID=586833 RepID=A0A667ZAF7_9TELE
MDADKWEGSLEKELLCPICLSVFTDPVQLPCRHNFCQGCISRAWAEDDAAVRCPQCRFSYRHKPALSSNLKLSNIVESFSSLSAEKASAALQCGLCRGPRLPAIIMCLHCKEPCCEAHMDTHLQLPSTDLGHLLVPVEDLKDWTCTQHRKFRVLHCEEEQTAVCPLCCITRCVGQRHTVCQVVQQHERVQAVLMRQQKSLDDHVHNIDDQLRNLETDKTLIQEAVSELKDRVKAQYERMHALLEEDLRNTMHILDSAHGTYQQRKSQQALQLKERRQEADDLRTSTQMFLRRTENIKRSVCVIVCVSFFRSDFYLGADLPAHQAGQLNKVHFLSELSKRERDLRRMLEEPLSQAALFQTVPSCSCGPGCRAGTGSGIKRKLDVAFQESQPGTSTSQDAPPPASRRRRGLLANQSYYHSSSYYSSETVPALPGPSWVNSQAHESVGHPPGAMVTSLPLSNQAVQYNPQFGWMVPQLLPPNLVHWVAPQGSVPSHRTQLPTDQSVQGLQ